MEVGRFCADVFYGLPLMAYSSTLKYGLSRKADELKRDLDNFAITLF